jgi:hypothetical protein
MRTSSVLLLASAAGILRSDGPAGTEQERLAVLQPLVGDWRGVGQPQRGSTKGSWSENAQWAWSFKDGPALVCELTDDRYFRQLRLTAGGDANQLLLTAVPHAGGEMVRYTGRLDPSQWIFISESKQNALPERLTPRFAANGDRLLILLERQTATGGYARLAEVGYTRQGSGFGKNVAQRECIVTGGLGTIEVSHNGQTYYVCCTGCRDYFNQNPDKVLAEYAARKK